MPLVSALFAGDRALEACLVSDQAHVTRGTRGPHVSKIQYALFAIDALVIDGRELATQSYGPSTAGAVLAFKRPRAIINRSYQSTADDIVGKMTIASLDREMLRIQRFFVDGHRCEPGPAGLVQAANVTASDQVKAPQFGKTAKLHLFKNDNPANGTWPLQAFLDVARNLLAGFGISLSVQPGGGPELLNTQQSWVIDEDLLFMRKMCEDLRPGLPNQLRVILWASRQDPGRTLRNISQNGIAYPPFVVINTNEIDGRSNATLLHEMIHASHASAQPHDERPPTNIFASQTATAVRNTLKAEHATSIASAFYCK